MLLKPLANMLKILLSVSFTTTLWASSGKLNWSEQMQPWLQESRKQGSGRQGVEEACPCCRIWPQWSGRPEEAPLLWQHRLEQALPTHHHAALQASSGTLGRSLLLWPGVHHAYAQRYTPRYCPPFCTKHAEQADPGWLVGPEPLMCSSLYSL